MPFIGKSTRVRSNNNQSLVPCGLFGTILSVQRKVHKLRTSVKYEILWDKYLVGLCFNREEFNVIPIKDSQCHQTSKLQDRILHVKRLIQKKRDYLSKLKSERIWRQHSEALALTLSQTQDTKAVTNLCGQINDKMQLNRCNSSDLNTDKLPAKGSVVCSVQNSTVRGGLLGVVVNTKCINGCVTFGILWKGYIASINYTIEEFTVTEYAKMTEDGEDPNMLLSSQARVSEVKPPKPIIIKAEYKQQEAKIAFDCRRREGHVTFDF
jgi:hypothetical protein